MGIKFQQKFGFGSKKIASSHPREVGETLDIYHLDVDWSLERKKKHAAIFQDEFSRAVKEIFDGEPFIYTINGSDNPHMFQNLSNGTYVPPKAHGSNSYRTFHNAAVYAHFNQSADRVGFLTRKFNLSEKQAWDLLNYDYYYQFICRTSLREFPLHLSVVVPSRKIILMDKDMAYYIHLIFTGSRLHHFKSSLISSIPKVTRGRKPVGTHAVSAYDRVKKHRIKIEYDDLQRKFKILSRKPLDQCINLSTRFDNEITLKRIDNEKRRWSLALVGNIKSADFKTIEYDQWDEVVAELEIKSKRTLRSKHSNSLFSMAQFKEENGRPLNRQLSSVVQVDALLMDMDSDQNCDPEAFANLFAGTKMVMYSSFNSSLTEQRYRVIIPFSHPVDAAEYRIIASDCLKIAEIHGFHFDPKKTANDIMYLPGVGVNPDAAFFRYYHEQRNMLDVDDWFGRKMEVTPNNTIISFSSERAEMGELLASNTAFANVVVSNSIGTLH